MKKEITQPGIPFDPNYFEDLSKRGVTKEIKDVFTFIYETNHWQGAESVSGAGSDIAQTTAIARALPSFLSDYSIRTMLDLPCGDFLWMSQLDLPLEQYIGADIVVSLVTHHEQTYASPVRQFRVLDLTHDTLPDVDLIFCRDCLVHLSFDDIRKVFTNLVSSNIQYILTTTFPGRTENKDIITGDWRTLNLQLSPFNLPAPIAIINEQCTEGNGVFADKSMALWYVKDLKQML
jgi:hypothetical protein